MGNCIHCGEKVGFLRKEHSECEYRVRTGIQRIEQEISSSFNRNDTFDILERIISEVERELISTSKRRELLLKGWESCVDKFLEDGILDEVEEYRLTQFKNKFLLTPIELDRNGYYTKTTKAVFLRSIMNGEIPQNTQFNGQIHINLQKSEKIVWAFPASDYLEDKIKREYIGGSRGVSIRVMKGVYYRAGEFKGKSIERTERTRLDNGWTILTNKNIYFSGSSKNFRIPYSKVVSFLPFYDGVGIVRDAVNAKPQIFKTGDGWFSYNLITNLSQL